MSQNNSISSVFTNSNRTTANIFDNMSDMSDDEDKVTHWMVYDGYWIYEEECERFDEDYDNNETFETLEEAQAEYNRRANGEYCGVYGADTIRLEECGGGNGEDDDSYPIDTVEYWERCTTEEFKTECLANQ